MLRTILSLRSPRLNSKRFLGVSEGSEGMKRSFIRGGGAMGGPILRIVDDCESALECKEEVVESMESPREWPEYDDSGRDSVESVRLRIPGRRSGEPIALGAARVGSFEGLFDPDAADTDCAKGLPRIVLAPKLVDTGVLVRLGGSLIVCRWFACP